MARDRGVHKLCHISSGSLSIPNNSAFRYTDVTGSDDTIFKASSNTYALVLPLASTGAPGSPITGDFAQLKITKFGSRTNNVNASYYISASVDGANAFPLLQPPSILLWLRLRPLLLSQALRPL